MSTRLGSRIILGACIYALGIRTMQQGIGITIRNLGCVLSSLFLSIGKLASTDGIER